MTPLLPQTWPTVDGHVIKSLLSQNNCWLGSRVVDLVVEGCTVVLVVGLVVVVGTVVVVVGIVVVVCVVVVDVVVVVWPGPQWPSDAISNEGFWHFATLNSQLWKYEIKQSVNLVWKIYGAFNHIWLLIQQNNIVFHWQVFQLDFGQRQINIYYCTLYLQPPSVCKDKHFEVILKTRTVIRISFCLFHFFLFIVLITHVNICFLKFWSNCS